MAPKSRAAMVVVMRSERVVNRRLPRSMASNMISDSAVGVQQGAKISSGRFLRWAERKAGREANILSCCSPLGRRPMLQLWSGWELGDSLEMARDIRPL